VTGAALRLGRAIALDLAKHGWRIGVHHHTSGAEAESLVDEIERLGSKAVCAPRRSHPRGSASGLVQSCAEELGTPTCLINNAARFEWDSIDTLDWAGWQAEIDVNLRAPVFLTQSFARTLPKDASGCVINMIDQRVWRLTPDFFSYTIAKSALWTATRMLAQALARAFASMRLALDPCSRAGSKVRQISSASVAQRRLAAPPRLTRCVAPCAFCSIALRWQVR